MKSWISILSFLFLGGFYGSAQLSKIHYIPPLAYADDNANSTPNRGQYLYISTPSATNVNVVITPIGGAPEAFVVNNVTPVIYEIQAPGDLGVGPSQAMLVANNTNQTARVHVDKGYIIEAVESEIYVALRTRHSLQAGALVSKGGAALGTQFRAGMYTSYDPASTFVSFISVMGTEIGTILTINNIDENVDLVDFDEGAIGSNAFNKLNDIVVNLNRGDTYTLGTV